MTKMNYQKTGPGVVAGAALVMLPATIASGQTTSGAVNVTGRMIAGIDLGASFTGTALGIQNAVDGSNYRTVYDSSGNAISWVAAGNRLIKFDPPLLGYESIKLVSNASEGSTRTLTVILVP